MICPRCIGTKGHGTIVDGWAPCENCGGTGEIEDLIPRQKPRGFVKGQRVRLTLIGTITDLHWKTTAQVHDEIMREPRYTIVPNSGTYPPIQLADPQDLLPIDGLDATEAWREIAADMIRAGRDAEVVKELLANAPHVVVYIKALEEVFEATKQSLKFIDFSLLPGHLLDRLQQALNQVRELQGAN